MRKRDDHMRAAGLERNTRTVLNGEQEQVSGLQTLVLVTRVEKCQISCALIINGAAGIFCGSDRRTTGEQNYG